MIAGSRGTLLEHRFQALAHSPFFGVQRQQNPAWVGRGCFECIHLSSSQHPYGAGVTITEQTPSSSSSLHNQKAAKGLGFARQLRHPAQDRCLFAGAHSEGFSSASRQDTLGISHSAAGLFTTPLPIQILTDVHPSLPNPAPTAAAHPAFTAVLSYKQFITRQ